MSDGTVLIIGAGIGGLTLAQALRRKGISTQIFERDNSRLSRDQGHALFIDTVLPLLQTLSPDGASPLRWTSVTKGSGIQMHDIGHYRNYSTAEKIADVGDISSLRANRSRLREWLGAGLDIQWGKQFVGYEVVKGEHRGVVAHFSDGSTVKGRFVVGADGVNSTVRASLGNPSLPPAMDMGVLALGGELVLTHEQYLEQIDIGPIFYVALGPGILLFGGVRWFHDDQDADDTQYSSAERSPSTPAKYASYYWNLDILSSPTEDVASPSCWARTAPKSELLAWVKHKSKVFHPRLCKLIEMQEEEKMMKPFVFKISKPTVLDDDGGKGGVPVTLLGDAAHSMPPFRAMGANQAMLDAFKLAEQLSKRFDEKALREYEREMAPRGAAAVEESVNAFTSQTVQVAPRPPVVTL